MLVREDLLENLAELREDIDVGLDGLLRLSGAMKNLLDLPSCVHPGLVHDFERDGIPDRFFDYGCPSLGWLRHGKRLP